MRNFFIAQKKRETSGLASAGTQSSNLRWQVSARSTRA